MTYKELLNKYGRTEKAWELIFYLSKTTKNIKSYLENKNKEIDFEEEKFANLLIEDKPWERITKTVYFCNKEFDLLDGVFCPRHETELIIESIKVYEPLKGKYIDICSGTGVIAITTKLRNPNLKTTALDISRLATLNIKANANKHQTKIEIVKEDWLEHLMSNNYQIITANFPYVGKNDEIDKNILKYDPDNSIFAKEEGWEHYRKLIEYLKNNETWQLVILECNPFHEDIWNKVMNENSEWRFTVHRDIRDKFRVIVITRY